MIDNENMEPEMVRSTRLKLEKERIKFEILFHPELNGLHSMDVSCNLKIPLENIIKCLIFETNQNISIAAIIPGTEKLSIKKLGYASGLKKTRLMSPDRIKIITGSELGGISPINVAPIMQTFADIKLLTTSYICGSAGSPFHMLKMNPIDLVKFGIFYVDISI